MNLVINLGRQQNDHQTWLVINLSISAGCYVNLPSAGLLGSSYHSGGLMTERLINQVWQ
jgi:hypothetical protein